MLKSYKFTKTSYLDLCIRNIFRLLGQIEGRSETKLSLRLSKEILVQTIMMTAKIEGNTLDQKEVTAIIDGERVIGKEKDILEIENLHELYKEIDLYDPTSKKSFYKAHSVLMRGLLLKKDLNKARKVDVAVVKHGKLKYRPPKASQVDSLLGDMFNRFNLEDPLISSCIIHFFIETIHPFVDGNGRIGRFWQTLILYKHLSSIFQRIPIEVVIADKKRAYYAALTRSRQEKDLCYIVEHLAKAVEDACTYVVSSFNKNRKNSWEERMDQAGKQFKKSSFTRKEYCECVGNIAAATGTRDLQKAVKENILQALGSLATRTYRFQ